MSTRRIDHVPRLRSRQPIPLPPVATDEHVTPGSAGHLRGIPAIGRGVTGAIPDTIPHIHGIPRQPRLRTVEP